METLFGREDHQKAALATLALRFSLHLGKKKAALYGCIQVARRVLKFWDSVNS
jgi:hypothetical protein